MAGGFKIVVNDVADALRDSILAKSQPVADACSAAIKIAGGRVLSEGRDDIARAGFGAKWQNTWRVTYYPETGKASIDAAAWAFHKIPYAEIFEDGGTITGKPYLWIPLRNAPKNFGRGHISPKKLRASGIKLFSITRAGKAPLLATKIYESRAASHRTNFNVTAASLKKSKRRPVNPKSSLVRVTVPLFFGVRSVTIRKQFHLDRIAQDERDNLPSYYVANLKDE